MLLLGQSSSCFLYGTFLTAEVLLSYKGLKHCEAVLMGEDETVSLVTAEKWNVLSHCFADSAPSLNDKTASF